MPGIEWREDGPEASYRRGYQQGARAAFDVLKYQQPFIVRHWIEVVLSIWRHEISIFKRFPPPPPT